MVDPGAIAGYPALDILNAGNLPVTPAAKPAQVRVYRWRPYGGSNGANPNIGGVTATARTILPLSPFGTFGPVQWELLIQNVDYYLDPSGLWLALPTVVPSPTKAPGRPPASGWWRSPVEPRYPPTRPLCDTRCGRSTGWPEAIWTRLRWR